MSDVYWIPLNFESDVKMCNCRISNGFVPIFDINAKQNTAFDLIVQRWMLISFRWFSLVVFSTKVVILTFESNPSSNLCVCVFVCLFKRCYFWRAVFFIVNFSLSEILKNLQQRIENKMEMVIKINLLVECTSMYTKNVMVFTAQRNQRWKFKYVFHSKVLRKVNFQYFIIQRHKYYHLVARA